MFVGTSWERYGVGRTLFSADTTSGEIGGSNTVTLTAANLPVHSHTVTATGTVSSTFKGSSVTTSSGNAMSYRVVQEAGLDHSINHFTGFNPASWAAANDQNYPGAEHTHNVTAKGSVTSTFKGSSATTSSVGSGTSFSVQNPYITVYMWKRIS